VMSATCVKFYNNGLPAQQLNRLQSVMSSAALLVYSAARAGLFWIYFDYFEQELDDFGPTMKLYRVV